LLRKEIEMKNKMPSETNLSVHIINSPFQIIFLILLVFAFVKLSYSQFQNVMISNLYAPNETSIAINPNNPNQMVAGSNILYNGEYRCGYYYSTNGGLNWSTGVLNSDSGKPYCDPGIAADKLGNFYYTADAGFWNSPPPYLCKLYCMKSTNGGVNWLTNVFAQSAPKMVDMPTICIDKSNSIYQNNIYVVFTQADTFHSVNSHNDSSLAYFSRSTDHGVTFSSPIRLSKHGGIGISWSNSYLQGCVCCTGPNGEIYAAWIDSLGIFFDRSTNGGLTWLDNDVFISQVAGGWTHPAVSYCGYAGTPRIDCDYSNGPHRGTVYLAWSDTRNPNRSDIWLVKSSDMGNTWSQSIRLNNDPIVVNKSHFFTQIAIDQANGNVYSAFYDNRNYSTGVNLDLFLACSSDGGNTFANVKVNTNPFTLCTISTGDYIGLAAYNNKVRPVWTEGAANNVASIWTAIIDSMVIGIQPISDKIPDKFSLFQNYPNPFNPETNIKFQIPKASFVTVSVFDITGRTIEKPVNEQLKAGIYEVNWNPANVSSGVYYYRMTAGDYIDTKKMVLVK